MKRIIKTIHNDVWVESPAWYKVFCKTVLTINIAFTVYVVISRYLEGA